MLQAYGIVISDHSAMPYLDTGFVALMAAMWWRDFNYFHMDLLTGKPLPNLHMILYI